MNKKLVIAALLAATSASIVPVGIVAAVAAKPAPGAYSTSETDLGTLLDNAATKAILDKYIHDMIANPQIDMARSMTLRQLQAYSGETLKDEVLAKIDADLAKVPAAKVPAAK